ncbi:MAG: hypothetical protein Greene041619_716 [Candidatus Peregrinibacteria bacterium Greene0416_19]|nr:MAG: hypothetical protein Greene041619_716 [Candidatus Peregrinibacteria bacterium Greene0416_19]
MQQYQRFIFDTYLFNDRTGEIQLQYSLDDDISFTETVTIPLQGANLQDMNVTAFANALRSLHLIGGISYYKTCLPKTLEIRSAPLTQDQAAFWNSVYENGLGEFFYRNNIDFRGLIHFPSSQPPPPVPPPPPGEGARGWGLVSKNKGKKPRVLVPLGGGKDSVVTAELLRKAGYDVTLLRMGHHPLIEELARTMKLPLLTVDRRLSPALFDLNAQGALNGHVPITAYLSFVAVIVALLHGFDAVAMSNERSANIGNVEFHGKEINHQWSKSLEFERDFQEYVRQSIATDIEYFSLLRPLSELHIAKLFTELPQYFHCTTSCNKNWKILSSQPPPPVPPPPSGEGARGWGLDKNKDGTKLWCGTCPKCAFVFLLYAAFLPRQTLEEIFGKNLFEDGKLTPLYRELLGLEGIKPFECVGTPEESRAAFLMAHERGDLDDTLMMRMFVSDVLPSIKNEKELLQDVFVPSDEHVIPDAYRSALPS